MEQRHTGGRSPFKGSGRAFTNKNSRGPSRFSRAGSSSPRSSSGGSDSRPARGAYSAPARSGGYSGTNRGASAFTPSRTPASSGTYTPRPYQGNSPRPYPGARAGRPSYSARPSSGGGRSSFGSGFGGARSSYGGGRSSFGGSRGGSFGGGARRGRGPADERIDTSRFINKAIITEEIEHFVPEHKFSDFKITEPLKKAITGKGYVDPTPIQDRSIPHILQGVDVVGIANTGTGKTGAFLIPLINKALLNPSESTLIVVPTRELAIQIDEELQGFVRGLRIFSVCAFGGSNINRQIDALRSHRHFVIGTPGRLKDLLERRKLNLSKVKTAVLDEADRMLDMGFVHDMRTILAELPKDRQTLFFSATLSPDIEKLIGEFLNEPVRISVKTRDTSKNIDQDVIRVPRGSDKFQILSEMLKKPDFTRTLIFGRTKHGVDKLTKMLMRGGISAESIHGNKNNSKRQLALRLFKLGKVKVLVATDVAARGLDIADVSHVINYDLPATYDDYVHRIGRTGRAAKKGIALTMVDA